MRGFKRVLQEFSLILRGFKRVLQGFSLILPQPPNHRFYPTSRH
ncbi:MAG: hypothetical protein RR054_04385 [Clostridia bacterium]